MTLAEAVDSVMSVNGSKTPRTSHGAEKAHVASAIAGAATQARRKLQTMTIEAVAEHVNVYVMTGEKGAADAVDAAHDCGSLAVEVRESNTVVGTHRNWSGDTLNICCRKT